MAVEGNKDRSARIAKNTLFLFIRMLIICCVSFYTSRVVLQTLGVDDFGIYNIVGSVVVFMAFFRNALTNATYRALTYELGHNKGEKLHETFIMSFNVHLILAVALFIVFEIIGSWFINYHLNIAPDRLLAANYVFQFSLLAFCIEVVKTPYNSIIIAHEQMNFYAYTSIVEGVLKLLIVYMLLLFSMDKLILYSILVASVAVIMYVWYWIYCRKHYIETKYEVYWNQGMLKSLLSYSGWSLVVNATDVSVVQCMNIFLNLFGGVAVNAAMGIANQVNALLNNFLATFSNSFNPQIIKSYAQKDYDYFMKLIFSTSRFSFFLLFTISFPVMINIDFLLDVWLVNPPEYAGIFLCLVACYSLIDSFSAPLWNAVHATGNLKMHQILMASIKILNIPVGYFLLKSGYPVYSILLLYVCLNMVCCIVRIIYMKTLIQLPVRKYFIDVLGRIFIVSLLTIILPLYCMTFDLTPIWLLFISSAVFIIPYVAAVYFLGLNQEERNFVNRLVKEKIGKSCINKS